MNLVKPLTMKWWQASIFKLGMLALGIVVGANWPNIFGPVLPALIALAVLCLAYITYIWVKQ